MVNNIVLLKIGQVFCCSVTIKLLLKLPQLVFLDDVLSWERFQQVTRSREINFSSSTSVRRRLAGLVQNLPVGCYDEPTTPGRGQFHTLQLS